MRSALFTIILLIFGPQAWAQYTPEIPPVWPAQLGSTGSAFKAGVTPTGKWMAWTYTTNGITRIYPICVLNDYQLVHPPTEGMTPIRTARAYWLANVATVCSRDPRMAGVFQAMVDEMWK